MKNDKVYTAVKKQWHDVIDLPPQTVGPLTPLYKWIVPFLKIHPWRVLIAVSFLLAVFAYALFDVSLVQLVSLLQRGI